jgi:hypothetical protein
MGQRSPFTITELCLCGLCLAGGLGMAVLCLKNWMDQDTAQVLQSGGMALLLFGGAMDPLNFVSDSLTFPFHRRQPSGYQNGLTRILGASGLVLSLVGLVWSLVQD